MLAIMPLDRLLLFIGAELVFSLTPGPTVMMISAYGFKGGFRDAFAAMCGTQTGNALWFALCAAGLGALVRASPLAFDLIRYLGAAYLVWLGLSALWKSWRGRGVTPRAKLMGRPYVQAVLTQMGNPKAILFFGALVPQFLDTHAPLLPQYGLMFAVTAIGEGIILSGYGLLAAMGGQIAGARHALWRERISGAVLLLLGLFAATRAP
ncbi:MAG TPA: LysE family translocator [Rhizomicrobium sp.]|jgi:homoserine/homoserine lactone efflux protein|nr:LysE family translocator [Rhizomicrobium sp.]